MKFAQYLLLAMMTQWLVANIHAGPIEPPKGIRHYEIGPAPGFTLVDIDGDRFTLDTFKGRWVFLHFWASWCGPCREEMPTIQRMSEGFSDDEFAVLLVNTAEDEDTIFSFLAEIDTDLKSLMDADGQVTEKFRPRGLPTTILIDPQGLVQYQAIGGREWHQAQYTDFLQALLDHQ
jgi:thiol-disulfide isomerase/thioredoxin